jgi:hypothetical protein
VSDPEIPASIVDIFDAMNVHDADRAASTVTPDVEIVVGPNVANGVDMIRMFALQDDPDLEVVNTPLSCHEDGDDMLVAVRRSSRFRSTDDPPVEEVADWSFRLAADGRIDRVVIGQPG